MNIFEVIGVFIIALLGALLAPFMTIGTILMMGGFEEVGGLFVILGFLNMVRRFIKLIS